MDFLRFGLSTDSGISSTSSGLDASDVVSGIFVSAAVLGLISCSGDGCSLSEAVCIVSASSIAALAIVSIVA